MDDAGKPETWHGVGSLQSRQIDGEFEGSGIETMSKGITLLVQVYETRTLTFPAKDGDPVICPRQTTSSKLIQTNFIQ